MSDSQDTEVLQREKCELRVKYLKAMANLVGKKCTCLLINGKSITGQYAGCEIECQNILLENIEEPCMQKGKNLILRSSDIATLTFDNIPNV